MNATVVDSQLFASSNTALCGVDVRDQETEGVNFKCTASVHIRVLETIHKETCVTTASNKGIVRALVFLFVCAWRRYMSGLINDTKKETVTFSSRPKEQYRSFQRTSHTVRVPVPSVDRTCRGVCELARLRSLSANSRLLFSSKALPSSQPPILLTADNIDPRTTPTMARHNEFRCFIMLRPLDLVHGGHRWICVPHANVHHRAR
jgi:hypothetical protein